jgi:hypothetical protein
MPQTQTRIVGSSFTAFYWNHTAIAFLDEVHDSGQQPIAQYQAVTPLGKSYPVEFALPRVKAEGTLQFVLRELWSQPSWWALQGFAATQAAALGLASGTDQGGASSSIVDVYNIMAATTQPIQCTTVITLPNGQTRGWLYNNCVLTTIDDSESVTIGALTSSRQLQAVYASKTLFFGPVGTDI